MFRPTRFLFRLLIGGIFLVPCVVIAQQAGDTTSGLFGIKWGEVWTKMASAIVAVPAAAFGGLILLVAQKAYAKSKRRIKSVRVLKAISRKIGIAQEKPLPDVAKLHERLRQRLSSFVNAYGALPARAQDTSRKKILAVVSGKGGVGKSTLTLGLTEYFATFTGVTLIDLDMPNRGLTSLLEDSGPQADGRTLFGEFTTFYEAITPKLNPGQSSATVPDQLQLPPRPPLNLAAFGDAQTSIKARDVRTGNDVQIEPSNGFLLRSITPPDLYLASDVFTASEVAVREFIFSLEPGMAPGVSTMIIDCHGAHDLLMVGAIQAATDIVVVMTAEKGSFDGTFELLAYALSNAASTRTVSITLVINNVAPWQEAAARALMEFFDKKFNGEIGNQQRIQVKTLIVLHSDAVRQLAAEYKFGGVSKTPLWKDVSEIGFRIRNQPIPLPMHDVADEFVAKVSDKTLKPPAVEVAVKNPEPKDARLVEKKS